MLKNEPSEIKRSSNELFGIYRAVVVDNDDSEEWGFTGGSGRVRVRVWGIHTAETSKTDYEGIPDDELPWAEPAYPVIEGSLTDFGFWSVPVVGTHVFVFFENGDHMKPKYFACAPGVQPDEYPDDDGFFNSSWIVRDRKEEADYSRIGRGETDDTFIESINDNLIIDTVDGCTGLENVEIEEGEATIGEYPHILSLETHGGHALTFDSTPDNKNFFYYHPSNTYININNDGKITIHSKSGTIVIDEGNRIVYIDGDSEEGITGSRKTMINANWTVETGGIAKLFAGTLLFGRCSGGSVQMFSFQSSDNHTHTCPFSGEETSKPNGIGRFEAYSG